MSLSPADTPQRPREEGLPPAIQALARGRHTRVWAICFAILAFEIGVFLLVFPWMDAWRVNHFPALYPQLFEIWDDPYVRGAVSGLGVVNLLIATMQVLSILRKSKNS